MKTKKYKCKTKKCKTKRRQRGGNNDIDKQTLIDYISRSTNNLNMCQRMDNCIKPNSKSGQRIKICDKQVYKGPPLNYKPIILKESDNIKLDPYTMNLLIQNITSQLVKDKTFTQNQIEHFNNICTLPNDSYYLESNKAGYKGADSLERYLLNGSETSIRDDFKIIFSWLSQVFNVLDKLHKLIQFHHCDPKAAQILLNKDGSAKLADLDKVTFTMKINKTLYRIRLTKQSKSSANITYIATDVAYNVGLLNWVTNMRFEKLAKNDCIPEKMAFLASCLGLMKSRENAVDFLTEYGNKLFNGAIFDGKSVLMVGVHSLTISMGFDFSLKNKKQQTSLGTPIKWIKLGKRNKISLNANNCVHIINNNI